jgi:hypothetical protein
MRTGREKGKMWYHFYYSSIYAYGFWGSAGAEFKKIIKGVDKNGCHMIYNTHKYLTNKVVIKE